MVNVARAGLNYLHTTRASPTGNDLSDIPGSFGIQGIPQTALNGGLPTLEINGLDPLGTNGFRPSDEVSSTFQFTDDLTKIYGKHTFKMEWEVAARQVLDVATTVVRKATSVSRVHL